MLNSKYFVPLLRMTDACMLQELHWTQQQRRPPPLVPVAASLHSLLHSSCTRDMLAFDGDDDDHDDV